MSNRTFTDQPAVRESVPLLVGLMGPSGSGKTYSALRVATGMQQVTGGEIFVIDTEHKRSLHYAENFKFRHVPFNAPFSPLDYLDAIEYCVSKGAKTIIVDSLSHEHEGPGGVLEWHEKEMDGDFKKQFTAWAKPKAARRRLINTMLQLGVNAVFCFRAKEKMKIMPDGKPKQMGWMPIAGDEFLYEMTVNCLLYPNSGGVPTWKSEEVGELQMMKLPTQFTGLFAQQTPLSEKIGKELASWAAGGEDPVIEPPDTEDDTGNEEEDAAAMALMDAIEIAETIADLKSISAANRAKKWSPSNRAGIKGAILTRTAELNKKP